MTTVTEKFLSLETEVLLRRGIEGIHAPEEIFACINNLNLINRNNELYGVKSICMLYSQPGIFVNQGKD